MENMGQIRSDVTDMSLKYVATMAHSTFVNVR